MTLTYDEARAIASAAKASGALKIDPAKQLTVDESVDRAALNKAIDALLESGQEFTVNHPTLLQFPRPAAAQRMCKLRTRGEAKLVREAPSREDWSNPRVWIRGAHRKVSRAESGRKGGLAKKKGSA